MLPHGAGGVTELFDENENDVNKLPCLSQTLPAHHQWEISEQHVGHDDQNTE